VPSATGVDTAVSGLVAHVAWARVHGRRKAGGKRGATVTILGQVRGEKTKRYGCAKLGRHGRFTIALPLAWAADGVALYRALAPIHGRSHVRAPDRGHDEGLMRFMTSGPASTRS
jgi:hypothetical protein